MEIPKNLKDEIWEYCRLNDITDLNAFMLKSLQQGFNIEKYGTTPFKIGGDPEIIEKARELGCEDYDDFFQWVNEYGLAWDFVEPKTEYNSGAGYYRWQISWGGGSDEFRIYISEEYLPHRNEIKKIEYWFLDWYDGASIETSHELIQEIIDCFLECSEIKTEREIEGGIE